MGKSKFMYKGPVYMFDKFVENWTGYTWAVSEAKALSNLSYSWKIDHKLLPGANVKLDADYLSEVTAIDDDREVEEYHQMNFDDLMRDVYGCTTYNQKLHMG